MPTRACEAVLFSDTPQDHDERIAALRALGVPVRLARDAHEALACLNEPPALALIDLGAKRMLTAPVIAQLNAHRGTSLVIALHHGALDAPMGELTRLRVDGFCLADAWDTAAFADLARPRDGSTLLH